MNCAYSTQPPWSLHGATTTCSTKRSVPAVLRSAMFTDLAHQAVQRVVCNVHHTGAKLPADPQTQQHEDRRIPPLVCLHHHAMLAGLLHAVLDQSPETEYKKLGLGRLCENPIVR